jgi:hypothetical protein
MNRIGQWVGCGIGVIGLVAAGSVLLEPQVRAQPAPAAPAARLQISKGRLFDAKPGLKARNPRTAAELEPLAKTYLKRVYPDNPAKPSKPNDMLDYCGKKYQRAELENLLKDQANKMEATLAKRGIAPPAAPAGAVTPKCGVKTAKLQKPSFEVLDRLYDDKVLGDRRTAFKDPASERLVIKDREKWVIDRQNIDVTVGKVTDKSWAGGSAFDADVFSAQMSSSFALYGDTTNVPAGQPPKMLRSSQSLHVTASGFGSDFSLANAYATAECSATGKCSATADVAALGGFVSGSLSSAEQTTPGVTRTRGNSNPLAKGGLTFYFPPIIIPVAFVDIEVRLGVGGDISFDYTHTLNSATHPAIQQTISPNAGAYVAAQAGVSLGVVGAGIEGQVDLVRGELPSTTKLDYANGTYKPEYDTTAQLTTLGGSLGVYVDVLGWTYGTDIFTWDGIPLYGTRLQHVADPIAATVTIQKAIPVTLRRLARPLGMGLDGMVHDAVVEGAGTPEERIGDFLAFDTEYLEKDAYPPGWVPVYECRYNGLGVDGRVYRNGPANGARFYTTDPMCNGVRQSQSPSATTTSDGGVLGTFGFYSRRVPYLLAMANLPKPDELKAAASGSGSANLKTATGVKALGQSIRAKTAAMLLGKETVIVYLCGRRVRVGRYRLDTGGKVLGPYAWDTEEAYASADSKCQGTDARLLGKYYLLKPQPVPQTPILKRINDLSRRGGGAFIAPK